MPSGLVNEAKNETEANKCEDRNEAEAEINEDT